MEMITRKPNAEQNDRYYKDNNGGLQVRSCSPRFEDDAEVLRQRLSDLFYFTLYHSCF